MQSTRFRVSALIDPATLAHVAGKARVGNVTARRQYGMAVERAFPLFVADVDERVANGYSRAAATEMVVHYPEWEVFPVKELNSQYLQNKSALEIEAPDEVICAARCAACLIHHGGFLVWSALIRRGFELIHGTPPAP